MATAVNTKINVTERIETLEKETRPCRDIARRQINQYRYCHHNNTMNYHHSIPSQLRCSLSTHNNHLTNTWSRNKKQTEIQHPSKHGVIFWDQATIRPPHSDRCVGGSVWLVVCWSIRPPRNKLPATHSHPHISTNSLEVPVYRHTKRRVEQVLQMKNII